MERELFRNIEMPNASFSNELRIRTKSAHDESDRLINLKLAAVLTDTRLWAAAVAEFYFVFREIEHSLDQLRGDPKIEPLALAVSKVSRVPEFEKDLEFYLGTEWRSVKPSPVVRNYCERIVEVTNENPVLIIAYGLIYVYFMHDFGMDRVSEKRICETAKTG